MRDEQLFEQAISLPPAERAQFVAENAVDEAQRVRVMDKVKQHQSIVRASMEDDMPSTLEGSTQVVPGVVIGPYKLREQIGQGGMGVVYVAEQDKPVKRRVALKLIKVGMDTKDVTARFEAERQALAIMDHPHIARVLDAGSTQSGRPYFVMELVRGIPITDYCDEQKLTIHERLALFMDVCKAIVLSTR